MEPMKVCPQCAEWVKADAKRCRYCGHELVTSPATVIKVVAGVVLGLILAGVVFAWWSEQQRQSGRRRASEIIECINEGREPC